MKKLLTLIFTICLTSQLIMAQSSMSDDQVMKFVLKEQKSGTSQQQIVTKLMQKGVDINQIRRIRKKYQRQQAGSGLGNVSDDASNSVKRLRTQNGTSKRRTNGKNNYENYYGDDEEDYTEARANQYTTNRKHRISKNNGEYDDYEFQEMNDELGYIMPQDTAQLVKQLQRQLRQKSKKVFGRDIFNNEELSFEPNMNIATPNNYVLGAGDEVFLDIYGASQKSEQLTVSPEGDITVEGYGPINVAGLTVKQANQRLRATLGARYSSSKIRLTVGQTKTIMINVMGEVKMPGTYTLSAFATVFHALYMAGGTNDLGTLRNIKVFRNSKLVGVVDIYDYILNGKLTGNVHLKDNDVIIVGPYDCLVNISGKVKRPMYYEMKKNESVETLLKYAGGFTGDAYKKAVRLMRKTGREKAVFNVGEFDMSAFQLADGDSVTVDSILNRYENTVEIKGAVFRPGMYQIGGQIKSVRSLISAAEGLTEEAFINRAVMHRMKEDRTLKVIALDIKGIMNGTAPDVALQENDVLFIPTKSEMMTERTITIHGEVHYPGIYKYADNETLEDFVLQAGGLTETASTVKVDVARRVNNPKALTTDSIIAKTYSFALRDGFVIDGEAGFTLMPFDEVYVRRSPAYNEQKNIQVEGNVMFPGTYTLSKTNERLSDIIKMAGGANAQAYIKGARLERKITDVERMRMEDLIRSAQKESGENDTIALKRMLNIGETYYVGIELDEAIKHPGGDEDIVLREGDRLIVPEYSGTVKISGEVMYPNTVAYQKGKSSKYYINQAGGWGNRAKKSHAYIIYMNGKVSKLGHGTKVTPGSEIVVPQKPKSTGSLAQWLTIGTSVASIATMFATIANLLK